MGWKFWVVGATLILAFKEWNPAGIPAVGTVGAVLMIIGCVLFVFDR